MSYCPNCGTENEVGAKFCSNCATKLDFQVRAEPTRRVISKPLILGAVALILILLVVLVILPRGLGIYGTYEMENFPAYFTEIKRDGTFSQTMWGMRIDGRWEREGNRLTFIVPGLPTSSGTIEGNRIIADDGSVWIKRR
ncbi:hypothetical protein HKBW3S44_01363 [Candidatus Hakubella thermalkaliphila]|uniref:Zinc-ribbon domain-containing protein n=1 Tax=Candidatus Hakubella thermalkaliphila TaxID=2754717 RepID=A0A6V8Q2R2_9ACTN|nr:zinc ribbon domain-containing protein [Candidatus Hakubella thermalkaliphila]GFP37686.1 hypothetical protein HKBW3S44_01363 [Candidatus Hakubella thermalkaliphila]